jgi:ubiquinone/menaquinone biosynthesis C-methylase UbiE
MDEQLAKQMAAQLRQPAGDEGIATGEWMNKGNMHINADTIKIVAPSANDTILEIGMGNGFFVKDILTPHHSIYYIGCDFSDVMVAEAEKINADWVAAGKARFVFSDMTNMPFDDGVFNKVFTINTVYFWEDASKNLTEIKRVLATSGTFILAFRPKHLMELYPFTKYGFVMFSKDEAVQLLTDNGFLVAQAIVQQEPDFDLNGKMIKIESVIITAVKP